MIELITIAALFLSGFAIGIAIGIAVKSMEEVHKKEKDEPSCENCKHGDLEWDEEPCDSCCGHCNWEEDNGDS